jgi:Ca2+/Na+ antiporter
MGAVFGFIVFFIVLCFVVYFLRPNKDRDSPYITLFLAIGCIMMFVASPVSISKSIISNILFLLPFVVFSFYLKFKIEKMIANKNKIVATQMQFWDIPVSHVISSYKDRIVKLDGREEIKDITVDKFFKFNPKGDKLLNKEIYSSIKRYRKFTKIKDTKYFEKTDSKVHQLLWKKITALNKQNETNINFEQLLKDNHFVLQFFILDLWEKLTKSEAIGVANLKSVAKNEKEKHLVGALYSLEYIPQKEGIELLAHYLNFKDRIKKIV